MFVVLTVALVGCFFYFTKAGHMFSTNLLKGLSKSCILMEYGGNGDTFCPPGYYVPKAGKDAEPSGYMRCCK